MFAAGPIFAFKKVVFFSFFAHYFKAMGLIFKKIEIWHVQWMGIKGWRVEIATPKKSIFDPKIRSVLLRWSR